MPNWWFPGIVILIVQVASVNNAINPACDCVVYQSYGKSKGRFHSPNFPNIYSRGLECILFTFIGDVNEIVELTFIEFDLRPKKLYGGCSDYLHLFLNLDRAEVDEHSRPDKKLCGNISHLDQKTYYSRGRSLILEFHSDEKPGTNHSGFHGSFKFLDASQFDTTCKKEAGTMCSYSCHPDASVTRPYRFFSPQYPQNYPKNALCEYKLYAPRNQTVEVVFNNIQLYNNNNLHCNKTDDFIAVFDGKDDKRQPKDIFCGVQNEKTVMSSGQFLYIKFNSDGRNEQKGFAATYSFTDSFARQNNGRDPTECCWGMHVINCNENISSLNRLKGTIKSQNYPGHYSPSTVCQYRFNGSATQRVQLNITEIDLYYRGVSHRKSPPDCTQQDSITVYDLIPGETKERELRVFCSESTPDIPRSLMSSSPYLRVKFDALSASSRDMHNRGFLIGFKFRTDFGISSGFQRAPGDCYFKYESRIAKNGSFTSPNYPGLYPRNITCHYIFNGNTDEKVVIEFKDFHVEGVTPRCKEDRDSDYVTFSNFVNVEDRKMSPLCGHKRYIDPIESDGAFFDVIFKSNNKMEGTGFKAQYTFKKKFIATTTTRAPLSLGCSSIHVCCTSLWAVAVFSTLVVIFTHRILSLS